MGASSNGSEYSGSDYSSDLRFLQRNNREDDCTACTFLWFIENYSCCWCQTGERLLSPNFIAHELEGTSWWVSVYPRGELDEDRGYISLYIGLNPVDDGPNEIDFNYELSVLAADGSILCSKVDKSKFFKSKGYGWPKFVEIEKITQDTLIVRCRIWKSGGKVLKFAPIRAITHISVENVSVLLVVENFSTFEPSQQKPFEMHSQSENGFVVSSSLYFNDEGEMIIKIRHPDRNHYICKRKISLLDTFENTVLCEETDNRFNVERKDIEKLPFHLTRQFLLNNKSQYLPDDKLTLLYECSFTIGIETEKTAATERGTGAEKVFEGIPDNRNQALSIDETLETESFTFDFTLKYRIEDFSTANEEVYNETGESNDLFLILIFVSVFPNGADKSDEGWLVVRPVVTVRDDLKLLISCTSLCTVSIIDAEGNSRFFRYFEICSHNVRSVKYLEKSFILERAGELISDDVLFLRCDMRTDLRVKKGYKLGSSSGTSSISFLTFLSSVPICEFSIKRAEGEDQSDTITIHDFTSQILTLPQFHESRKRFGVHGLPPSKWNERPEVDNIDNLENVWIFDTESRRCLLSFDQRPGNIGRLLLDSSPVIRRCINAPMKEQDEKRIDLSHVNCAAFLLVLHFLESGLLPTEGFQLLMEIYKFSHMYEMENLQRKCAERMVESSKHENQLDEIKRTANTYSDEYLLNLLESRWRELENLDVTRMDDRLNFDCYN